MEYLTQEDFKKMVLLSYQRVEEQKDQINKINIFPVPDQDTGTNLTKTLLGIKAAISSKEFKDLNEVSQAVLDGAIDSAQGNAGVIYTGFLAGFLPVLDKNPVGVPKLSLAFEEGAKRARISIQSPKEGTILDVIEAVAEVFKKESESEKDIIVIFKKALASAHDALLKTREKMEIFKKANVVDAGGLGFLIILESYLEALTGEKKEERKEENYSEKIRRFVQTISYRYEIVSLIENSRFSEKSLKEKLKNMGDCLDIVQAGSKTKIHIHTDSPDEVKGVIRESGVILSLREEDMAKEVVGEESVKKVSIGIVTEDVAMLLPKIIERYQVEIVGLKYEWPVENELPGENLYQKMREADKRGIKIFPKTSQAPPKSYFEAYQKQLQKFDKVLCIALDSKVSGSYNSARQAVEMLKEEDRGKVYVIDSLNAAGGQALLVLRAIELIQERREIEEVIEELENLIPQTRLYIAFEDPKWVEAIGRISRSQADWIRRMKKINLHPLMELKKGVVSKGGVVFAHDVAEAIFKKILKESRKTIKEKKGIRVIICHADNLEQAEKLKKIVKERIGAEVPFISLGPLIICAAVGPGALLVGWAPAY